MIVTEEPTGARLCAGVDWAKDDHAVCIVGSEGEALQRFMVKHDRAGLKDMVRRLLGAGVDEVGIERPDGPIVDAPLQAGLTVLVIPPAQVKNLRSRYGCAGNKGRPVRRLRAGRRGMTSGPGSAGGMVQPSGSMVDHPELHRPAARRRSVHIQCRSAVSGHVLPWFHHVTRPAAGHRCAAGCGGVRDGSCAAPPMSRLRWTRALV
jgi:Transposase